MNEWKFIQRVIPNTDQQLKIIDQTIEEDFLPALYGLQIINSNDSRARCMDLPIKFGGLALPTPSKEGEKSFNNSLKMSQHLSDSIQQITTFDFVTHLQVINEEKKKIKILTLKHNNDELSLGL